MYCYGISELTKEIMEKIVPNSSVGIYNGLTEFNDDYPLKLSYNGIIDVVTFLGNISDEFHWSNLLNECTKAGKSIIIAVPSTAKDKEGNEYFLGEFLAKKEYEAICYNNADIPVNHFCKQNQEIPTEFILGYCTYTDEKGFELVLNKKYIGFKSKEEQADFFESIKDKCKGIIRLDSKTKLDLELEDVFTKVVPYTTLYKEQLKRKLKGIDSYKSDKVQKELEYVNKHANSSLVNNPAFNLNFKNACRCLSKNTGNEDFKVEILDDGKTIFVYTLSLEQTNIPNQHFDCFTFTLEGDNLAVDRVEGKAYDATSEDFKENNLRNSCAKTAVELNYSKSIYDEFGIELSKSSLSTVDFIMLDTPYDELDISTLALSNEFRPEFSFDSLPKVGENLIENYDGELVYRTYDNLSLAYCKTSFRNKNISDDNDVVQEVDTNHPERLIIKFGGIVGIWNIELNDYEVSKPTSYGLLSFNELYDIYKESFQDALDESKTKEENKTMYESLLNVSSKTKAPSKRRIVE